MYDTSNTCNAYYLTMMTTFYISTAASATISLILIIVAVKKSQRYSRSSAKTLAERRMIVHAAMALVMLMIWVTTYYLANTIDSMYNLFDSLSFFVFFVQHYPPMLVILWIRCVLMFSCT
uniref:G_PROTEIN_RECEP_F1_2 domain-containing protein n=1 Tax=Panagrellus redivivus TaxID=6233 RepID=A0A7E4V0H0_PANRE